MLLCGYDIWPRGCMFFVSVWRFGIYVTGNLSFVSASSSLSLLSLPLSSSAQWFCLPAFAHHSNSSTSAFCINPPSFLSLWTLLRRQHQQMFPLLSAVTIHFSVSHEALELTRSVQGSRNSQEKKNVPEEFEQIWVRRSMCFVELAAETV